LPKTLARNGSRFHAGRFTTIRRVVAPAIAAMLIVVGLAAIATAIRTRQVRAPWASTLAAIAAAIGVLAWVLLDGLGVDLSLIAYVIAPFLLAAPVLLVMGKLSELRQSVRR
jgi:Ca2+/Na+ antiporter